MNDSSFRLIGWESGVSFLNQSQGAGKQHPSKHNITFNHQLKLLKSPYSPVNYTQLSLVSSCLVILKFDKRVIQFYFL